MEVFGQPVGDGFYLIEINVKSLNGTIWIEQKNKNPTNEEPSPGQKDKVVLREIWELPTGHGIAR